jgi:ubiquitin carboxyl-terminal hydrolase 34
MNSMLQQFFLTKPFRYLLMMADDGAPPTNVSLPGGRVVDDNILHQLQRMFSYLELTEKQDYSPEDFCTSFKDFEGNAVNVLVQQDAQEFLNMLLDRLEGRLKGTPFQHILEGVYGGKVCNQFVCSSCKNSIERH